ncbi:hypothetical protein QTP88_017968 [Uroleucon formosanum]
MFDLSTITSVVRLHIRFLAHPLMIVFLFVKKTIIMNYIRNFDDIVYRINDVSLKPYMIHFFSWLSIILVAEFLQLMTFHHRRNLRYFTISATAQFVLSNVWLVTPVLMYIFLISLVSYSIREINDITSIRAWKTHCLKWKELQHAGIKQMKRTQILLNGAGITILSDYREFISTYMLHADFSFMPNIHHNCCLLDFLNSDETSSFRLMQLKSKLYDLPGLNICQQSLRSEMMVAKNYLVEPEIGDIEDIKKNISPQVFPMFVKCSN